MKWEVLFGKTGLPPQNHRVEVKGNFPNLPNNVVLVDLPGFKERNLLRSNDFGDWYQTKDVLAWPAWQREDISSQCDAKPPSVAIRSRWMCCHQYSDTVASDPTRADGVHAYKL